MSLAVILKLSFLWNTTSDVHFLNQISLQGPRDKHDFLVSVALSKQIPKFRFQSQTSLWSVYWYVLPLPLLVLQLNAALKSDALSDPVALETGLKFEIFEGLGGPDTSVSICETRNLPAAISLDEAMATLRSAIFNLQANPLSQESGTLRLQVSVISDTSNIQYIYRDKNALKTLDWPLKYNRDLDAKASHAVSSKLEEMSWSVLEHC